VCLRLRGFDVRGRLGDIGWQSPSRESELHFEVLTHLPIDFLHLQRLRHFQAERFQRCCATLMCHLTEDEMFVP